MMLAYALSAETAWTATEARALHIVISHLGAEHLPAGLGFDWDALMLSDDGFTLRGTQHVTDADEALWLVSCLKRLSARFPALSLHVAGAPGLMPTTLQAGEFGMFGESYERALANLSEVYVLPLPRHARH